MLRLHFANHLERLADRLVDQLGARDRSPFEVDEVVIPSTALRRHLTLQLARRHGLCAQVRFSWLAQWLWQQMSQVLPGVPAQSPWAPPLLAWRLYAAFGDQAFVAAHGRLAAYLAVADDVMRLDLAQRVAGLFDQYLTYRPEWLEAWREGRSIDLGPPGGSAAADHDWQAALWRRLVAEEGGGPTSPAADFLQALQTDPAAAARLPRAVHVFALPTMPPAHLALLKQVAQVIDVQVYALNPCREFWFDVVEPRQLARLAARGRASHAEVGHRLLAGWGRQARSHLGLMVDACGDGVVDDTLFDEPAGDTLLARLQASILELQEPAPGSWALAPDDRSVEVHVCHSLTREVEVLHDRLLGLFATHPALTPADVLVVTPDLEAAAPLIDAVFGSAPAERRIPYTLTGLARSGINSAARVLMELLSLVGSRAPVSRVFGLLQQPLVARRFGLDDASLDHVRDWLQAAGVHWGFDAAHREALGLPAQARYSLEDGLERLFLGYALPDATDEPFAGELPAGGAEGQRAHSLGSLWAFVQALAALRRAWTLPHPAHRWPQQLADAVETFMLADADALDDLQELRQAIETLATQLAAASFDEPLGVEVVQAALARQLDDPPHGGVPTGSVTFSSMSSLRNVPCAVVCAIGLDDGKFPGADRPAEFDLLALRLRDSDRQRRHDERNLFLDLLLAARHTLHLSHVGRSVRDNAVQPPSVLIAELLEFLRPAIACDPSTAGSQAMALALAHQRLVVEHPLQGFAELAFRRDTDLRLRSFNAEYAAALQQPVTASDGGPLSEPGQELDEPDDDDDDGAADTAEPLFFTAPLAPPPPELRTLGLERLLEFFRAPCRFLLRHRLGIDLRRPDEELQDDETFVPGLPERRLLADRLLPRLMAGWPVDALRPLAQAGHELPVGAFGQQLLDSELPQLAAFAQQWRTLTDAPVLGPVHAKLDFDIGGEPFELTISLADLRPQGLQRQRYDDLRGADMLDAWLHHLALCAIAPDGVAPRTAWLARDGLYRFEPCADAKAEMAALLRLYRHGLTQPLYFFPRSAWALLGQGEEKLYAARSAWMATKQRPYGESADPASKLALRGWPDPLGDGLGLFREAAQAVLTPLLAHLQRPEEPA